MKKSRQVLVSRSEQRMRKFIKNLPKQDCPIFFNDYYEASRGYQGGIAIKLDDNGKPCKCESAPKENK